MRFRQLGRSGLRVSEVGLGCNNFGGRLEFEPSKEVILAAFESGINLFDTADIYGGNGASEEIMGEVIKPFRHEVVLATKFGMDMGDRDIARGSRKYMMKALEGSLRRLQTDHIDLYQLHQPDPLTPIEETLAALTDAVHQGKIRYIGSSNFAGWQLVEAELLARSLGAERLISAQNHYSILERSVEAELIPAASNYGVGILPFYPLASGLLTGKFRRGEAPAAGTRLASRPEQLGSAEWDLIGRLEVWAKEHDMELLDLAFAYLLGEPQVGSVIAGATSRAQVQRNVATQAHVLTVAERDEVRACIGDTQSAK
ncbi:aldo/keto reductase [Ferrimicrobium acidiphilum]|uniref:L-glyceraldehyde 3-phosphate reductase n=1 Tax=Ferrimicrobium acidiphilum DSM 19497 TaxID=1121877 RepID=A0A0D8FTV8_9ACTN|nr:aldo/keto reductase [Ferrimicrobium acidiphilum]KJE76566.1 L-glyceraldehyde 3-phosphate reductase [Ferrimicrobium acidiphilum DSM 19497]